MRNPYLSTARKQSFAMAGTGEPLPRNFKNAGGSSVIADSGDINAHSRKEAIAQISAIMDGYNTGSIVRSPKPAQKQEVIAQRKQALAEAFSDREGKAWRILGEVVGDEIWETMNREGFMRKLFLYSPVGKGEECRIRIRQKDVVGYQVTGPTSIVPSIIRQPYVYPPEFEIAAHLWIQEKELAQSSGDLLEEKYQDGLEQVMVIEDRIYRNLANAAAPVSNTVVFFNTLTPSVFAGLRAQIIDWGIPVVTAVLASDLWNDIIADTSFSNWFEPVTKHEIILEGTLGSLLGTELHTDAFRMPNLKVLESGEIFFNGAPETLGSVLQRQEVLAEPVNNYTAGRAERGWFMFEILAMQLVNARAISKGQRI